jgi:putative peptidoglycan lipid II flippase
LEKVRRRASPMARRQSASGEGFGNGADENEAPTILQRAWAIARRALPRGALILSSLTFVNFAVGLLETKVIAHVYGAGTESSAFYAAFALPALILDILVVGGLIASFVPVYVGLRDEEERLAREFARTILTLALLVIAALVAVMIVFAPECVAITAPGFNGVQRDLTINLFRLLAATQILFAAVWVLGEILIAEKRWLSYAVAPITYSAGIIAGALLLGGDGQLGIYGAAVGAFGGALAYAAIRLVGVLRAGVVPWPRLSLRTRGLRQYLVLMGPKMLSQPLEGTLITFYFTVLASQLATGAVANLTFARKFQTAPELIIGAQFAIAAFPALSAAADAGDRRGFRKIFGTNLATIAVLSTAAALSLLALGWLAVGILLSGGAYTAQDVATTTMLVAIFAVSIPLESLVELVARAIYATKNTGWPLLASVAGFVALFITARYLVPLAGLAAIPAAYGVGMGVRLVFLAVALAPRMEAIGRPPVVYWPAFRDQFAAGAHGAAWPSPTLVDRPAPRPDRGHAARVALATAGVVVLLGAGGFTAVQALQNATLMGPVTTPWARVRPSAVAVVTSTPSPTPTAVPTWQGTIAPVSGPTPTPTPPGQFAMDLYQPGDFVGEFTNEWCVPAAMQTMMNIMDQGADTSQDTQAKLYALAVSIAENRAGGPLPAGWAGGLQQLGYGKYQVAVQNRMLGAVKQAVKQIRLTNRPAGLLVWYGWHSWVVSGFVATADPAITDNFTVISLFIEDVWYNRQSKLWNKDRNGYSRPPDSEVPYAALATDFKDWDQAVVYPEYQKRWVIIVPVQ